MQALEVTRQPCVWTGKAAVQLQQHQQICSFITGALTKQAMWKLFQQQLGKAQTEQISQSVTQCSNAGDVCAMQLT